MSRLRELRLHGFKSFADPTRFVFERGVNAVLGPNGSGKSNMADAVRWVLGEQSNRSLRTRRADDVIFAGSEQRKPLGMAEAVLTLDNADGWLPIDFAEVSIGRRAYRSGEGEYLINGARARLRDVVELLGSGRLGANELVVVGQGTVDAALSLRPEERRQLFEEAAGVKALHVKRNEASGRLTRAADNLTRVSDLVAELKPQVRRLALQAEHQQQHDALGARALALVTESYGRRERTARSALGEARRAAAAAEGALQAYRASQEAERQALAAADARYWEADEQARAAGSAREGTREALIRLEGRLEALDARLAEATGRLDRERAELAALETTEAAASERPDTDLESALAGARRAEAAWRAATAQLATADERLIAAEEAVASLRASESDRIAAAARSAEEGARRTARREQAAAERRSAAGELEAASARAAAAEQALTLATERARTAAEALDAAEAVRDRAQSAADAATQALLGLEERIRAGRAELEALVDPADGARRLSRRLAGAGWRLLLDSLGAADDAWPAIEAVVGGELEAALLWSGADPADQLEGARGTARLLAATTREEPSATARARALEAVAGERTLAEWLGVEEVPAAFRRTVMARDVDALLAGWGRLPDGWSAVTRDGDLADARGVIALRGRDDVASGAAARAHVRRRELAATVEDLERRAGLAQRAAHETSEELRVARAAHLAAAEVADAAQRQVRLAREEVPARQADVRRIVERLGLLDEELAALAALPGDDHGAAEPSRDLAALQRAADEARTARDAIAQRRDEARAAWGAAREAAEAAEIAANPLSGGAAVRAARIAQLHASLPASQRAVETLDAERLELRTALEAARNADEEAASRMAAAEQDRGARREDLLALERRQVDASGRVADLERAAQSSAIEASRRDEALVTLARERELALESLPQVASPLGTVSEPHADLTTLEDDALEAELRRVRRTLAQIGSVNPFAVEEHRELAGRLDEMTAQESDLHGAIAATEELIARLDAEIAQQFDAAFKAIGARFDEFCRLLFAGGSGSLSVGDAEDGEDPGGIEIVVRPPGKRLQRLSMLSGGERALTGVALLFAMLSVNPVPFCILDEVDAALDEANIGRFAQALRRLSESIDFVVITHNRATIEVADTIYGVTMTDAAVSRVLSLRLADLPAEVVA